MLVGPTVGCLQCCHCKFRRRKLLNPRFQFLERLISQPQLLVRVLTVVSDNRTRSLRAPREAGAASTTKRRNSFLSTDRLHVRGGGGGSALTGVGWSTLICSAARAGTTVATSAAVLITAFILSARSTVRLGIDTLIANILVPPARSPAPCRESETTSSSSPPRTWSLPDSWICTTGNRRTGKWRTKSQGWKMTDWKMEELFYFM